MHMACARSLPGVVIAHVFKSRARGSHTGIRLHVQFLWTAVGANQSSCPSTWVAWVASKSVQMFSFSLLFRKSLSDSGRFGMGENKHERNVFLHLGIGVGHGGWEFSL